MSDKTLLCVGGPLDGLLYEHNEKDARHFIINETAMAPLFVANDNEDSAPAPKRVIYNKITVHFEEASSTSFWAAHNLSHKAAFNLLLANYARTKQ